MPLAMIKSMIVQCGRGKKVVKGKVGKDNKILIIQISPPASPLQNIDKTLTEHGIVGARRVMGFE